MQDFTVKNLNLSAISSNFTHSFNFSVCAGNCLGIYGPSGIGKSVLLKALADLLPHQGELFLGELESQSISAPQWRKKVMLLPAESQWWYDTVGEHFSGYDETLFTQLGFTQDVLDWQVSHLSSGEKQRLACIRVLVNQPEVLLLDEPSANLDHINRCKLEALISDYQKKFQTPVIWISHDYAQLEKMCQQILIVNQNQYELKILSSSEVKTTLEADNKAPTLSESSGDSL